MVKDIDEDDTIEYDTNHSIGEILLIINLQFQIPSRFNVYWAQPCTAECTEAVTDAKNAHRETARKKSWKFSLFKS